MGKLRPELVLQARELRRVGCSVREVAEYFGVAQSTIDRWLKAQLEPAEAAKADPGPLFQLVADRRYGVLVERRRWDCALLSHCERTWIAAYGARQARCPSECPGAKAGPKRTP